jgi:hypothetical protein
VHRPVDLVPLLGGEPVQPLGREGSVIGYERLPVGLQPPGVRACPGRPPDPSPPPSLPHQPGTLGAVELRADVSGEAHVEQVVQLGI